MITGRNIQWKYPTSSWILKGIDISIEPGSFILVTGASGSGKSTLCRTFNGLIPRSRPGRFRGEMKVFGRDTRKTTVSALSRDIGMVLQNAESQLFTGKVRKELAYGLESRGLPRKEIESRVRQTAGIFGIEHLLERHPKELSGGEQKIVLIAAISAMRPRILVLDEPFANLDYPAILRIMSVLRSCREAGTGIIIFEHRLHHLLREADRVIVMEHGLIRFDGTPAEAAAADIPILHEWSRQDCGGETVPIPTKPSTENGTVVECRGLSCSRNGTIILDDINFTLHRGESVAILGRNGAGKTTLLRHLNGLIRPQAGEITVLGHGTRETPVYEMAKRVGLVFQNPDFQFFRRTVREEVEAGAKALGSFDPGKIDGLLRRLEIAHLSERMPFFAGEGEKKRIAVASVLSGGQSILALDEPTAGLDWMSLSRLSGLFRELVTRGHTLLLVTQDTHFARLAADRWLILAGGRIAADGRPDDLLADSRLIAEAGLDTSLVRSPLGRLC